MVHKHKSCSFFGHRNVEITEELKSQIKDIIKNLIVNFNVQVFLFGSRSNFDCLCRLAVSELKAEYSNIKRVSYTCKSEACILENQRQEIEKIYERYFGQDVGFMVVEEEIEHKTKQTAGRASYVQRNKSMIDDSDFCVFFYDENYRPQERKYAKNSLVNYQPKSGTALAFEYAKRKKKSIINVFAKKY